MTTQRFMLAAGLLAALRGAWAADTVPATVPAALPQRSDAQFAHELFRLNQVDLIKAQAAAAPPDKASLWKAQAILAQFDALTKDPADLPRVTDDYLAALNACLKTAPKPEIDGSWALDHTRFVLSKLAQPILTRMEYFSPSPHDRQALAPIAAIADALLAQAGSNLEQSLKVLEAVKPFDERTYMRAYSAAADVRYYRAWTCYARAMALPPADEGRPALLAQAADALGEWAVDESDNGVNFQAYLLRGKVYAEAGDAAKAQADFEKAESDQAPNGVAYQARYQTVVEYMRTGNVGRALTSLEVFRKWIPKENADALISADLLGFRVAWAGAEAKTDPPERYYAERGAMEQAAAVIQKDARFRDLVYELVASQVPDGADLTKLLPLQQLAMARLNSRDQKGETPDSRRQLQAAADAALAVKKNALATAADKLEATFLAGVCEAMLNNLMDAAKYEIEFGKAAPKDNRARAMVDLALQQIGELRKNAATDPAAALELRDLAAQGLDLAIGTFGDKQWLYAQGRLMEESGKANDAAAVYGKIAPDDRNYFEARYRLVAMATDHFADVTKPDSKAAEFDQRLAATELFDACSSFTALLEKPPASVPKETLDAAKAYRVNIWLIEIGTALHPAVLQAATAMDRLNKLDSISDQLTDAQKQLILRYRIQVYQLAGKPDEAKQVVRAYVASGGEKAIDDLRGMALSAVDEIDKVEGSDPARAKRLAADVVQLLEPLIEQAAANGGGSAPNGGGSAPNGGGSVPNSGGSAPNGGARVTAFEYRLIQAEMMAKAGQFKEAQALAGVLEKEKPEDIRAYMTEARAMYAEAVASGGAQDGFARTQDYFTRILARMSPGSEGFWECWLRIVQSMEAQGDTGAASEIKARLGDLKGVYGVKFGGERQRAEFEKLAAKYGV